MRGVFTISRTHPATRSYAPEFAGLILSGLQGARSNEIRIKTMSSPS
jgi:hypothetical protein